MTSNRILIVACVAAAGADVYMGLHHTGAWALLAALLSFSAGMRVMR